MSFPLDKCPNCGGRNLRIIPNGHSDGTDSWECPDCDAVSYPYKPEGGGDDVDIPF